MSFLWQNYVFRRKRQVLELWEEMFAGRKAKVLYIAGCGFDVRVTAVLKQFLDTATGSSFEIDRVTLALIQFNGYELDADLRDQTRQNSDELRRMFGGMGDIVDVPLTLASEEPDYRVSHALQAGTRAILALIQGHTDVLLDVSSLPRVVYLALMTGILDALIEDRESIGALEASGVNFQVLVAEDANLDALIRSEDPTEDLVMIPGFGGGIKVESMATWPVVWFPILGERRIAQFAKVASLAEIPADAEICPVLPHPSRDPRRGDALLVEYRQELFGANPSIPLAGVMYAHESNPFEAYRQIRSAIQQYRETLKLLDGCRILVTPLSSKLMTIGAGLACYEMKPVGDAVTYALGIPCAAPTRYVVPVAALHDSVADLSALLLTGHAYANPNQTKLTC
jgi:hypothetical protein